MTIETSVQRGIILLKLSYADFDPGGPIHSSQKLGGELEREYLWYRDNGNPPDITLQIISPVGSAGLCRGIFQLAKLTRAARGVLTVKGYPLDYIMSLKTLGIDQMPGVRIVQ